MVLNLLFAATLIFTGFDFGGRVGAAFPTGGINRHTRSSTLLGAQLGYTFSRHRLGLNYSFLDFAGKQNIRYEMTIHELSLSYSYALFAKSNWGIALGAGPGYGYIRRTYNYAQETGYAPDCHINLFVYQQERHSRVCAGIDNIVFFSAPPNRSPVFTYFPAIYAEVGYAF